MEVPTPNRSLRTSHCELSPMNPNEIQLFHAPENRLRMTVAETVSYVTVKPVWAAPLSHPGRFLSLVNGKGDEITTIADLGALPTESQKAVKEELRRRYLTPRITRIESARSEFGITYWTVQTDRGRRDFVTQSLQENAQWIGDGHLVLVDVDGNRFEIEELETMDVASREFIERIV